MLKLYGFNDSKGEYQGQPYHNYQLFGVNDHGKWEMVKVKAKVVEMAGIYDLNSLVGNDLQIFYNRFGNVESIRVG